MDGEAKFSDEQLGKVINDVLDEGHVYLIVDNKKKNIWLYKGEDSGILLQFIGADLLNHMKNKMNGFYSVGNFEDFDSNLEYEKEILNSKINKGDIKEIIKGTRKKISETLTEKQIKIKEKIEGSRAREVCVHDGIVINDVISKVITLENPDGLHRHMTLIGSGIYTEETIIDNFITEKKSRRALKKVGNLPNGFFFLENLSARLIIKRGKVECIDFMAENNRNFGLNKLLVPIIRNDKLQNTEDISTLLNSFKKKEA